MVAVGNDNEATVTVRKRWRTGDNGTGTVKTKLHSKENGNTNSYNRLTLLYEILLA